MERKGINLSFDDKTLMINTICMIHDAHCKFEFVDEYTMKIVFTYRAIDNDEEDTIKEMYIHFIDNALKSFGINEFTRRKNKFKGRPIDDHRTSDLENLDVEAYDFFFNSTLVFVMCAYRLTPNGYGNKLFIKFFDIKNIEVY